MVGGESGRGKECLMERLSKNSVGWVKNRN